MLEKDTRNFIDKKLLLTGYSLDHRQVVFEYPLNFQGKNFFLDYALFDTDGSVIALIEAKRYERSAKDGLFQALEYAQILESQQGFRPFIFLATKILKNSHLFSPYTFAHYLHKYTYKKSKFSGFFIKNSYHLGP